MRGFLTLLSLAAFASLNAHAQPPATTPSTGPAPAPVFRRPPAFPERPPADPAVVERGKAIYGVHCTFCHGADARGGSGGPNLIRSALVLNDKDGELIGPVIHEGREGMPKFNLPETQIKEISAFIHSFKVGGYDVSRMTPPTIVTGDAKAGEAYFQKTCSTCHSVTGNLKGIGAKITDAKRLQQTWLMPGTGGGPRGPGASTVPPVTVTVTTAAGKVNGRLSRIDDFLVTLIEDDGTPRTFTRDGDSPKVEIHDPLQGHRQLLSKYTDKDIHDVTAYLVTIK